MANFEPASFIPKEPISSEGDTRRSGSSNRMGLLFLIGVIVAGFTLLMAAGIFGYQYYISSQLEAKKQQLEEAQSALEPDVLEDLVQLDNQLKVATELVSDHTAVTPVFQLLQEETLSLVQVKDFSVEINESGAQVTGTGLANGYKVIALQKQALNDNESIQDSQVFDFAANRPEAEGAGTESRIRFKFSFSVPREITQYKNTLQ